MPPWWAGAASTRLLPPLPGPERFAKLSSQVGADGWRRTRCLFGPGMLGRQPSGSPKSRSGNLAEGTDRLQLGKPQKHRRFLSDSRGGEPSTEVIAEACDFPLTGGGGMWRGRNFHDRPQGCRAETLETLSKPLHKGATCTEPCSEPLLSSGLAALSHPSSSAGSLCPLTPAPRRGCEEQAQQAGGISGSLGPLEALHTPPLFPTPPGMDWEATHGLCNCFAICPVNGAGPRPWAPQAPVSGDLAWDSKRPQGVEGRAAEVTGLASCLL